MNGQHEWCPCTTVPCGVGLTGHEGHCCLTRQSTCTDDRPGAVGWLIAHQKRCHVDHEPRVHELATGPVQP